MVLYILNRQEELLTVLHNDSELDGILDLSLVEDLAELSTLDFDVSGNTDGIEYLSEENYILTQNMAGKWKLFVTRKVTDIHGASVTKRVYAEDILSELGEYTVGTNYAGQTVNVKTVLTSLLKGTGFVVGAVDTTIPTVKIDQDTRYISKLALVQMLAELADLHIFTNVTVNGSDIEDVSVSLTKTNKSEGKRFEFDGELSSIQRDVDTSAIKTAILPLGSAIEQSQEDIDAGIPVEYVTIREVEWYKAEGKPFDKPRGQELLIDPVATAKYGIKDETGKMQPRVTVMQFSDIDDPALLAEKAFLELDKLVNPQVNYTFSASDMSTQLAQMGLEEQPVEVGDVCYVLDSSVNPPIIQEVVIRRITGNPDDRTNMEVEIGTPLSSFVDDNGTNSFTGTSPNSGGSGGDCGGIKDGDTVNALTIINGTVTNLRVINGSIQSLTATSGEFEDLTANTARVQSLFVNNANFDTIMAGKADIGTLNAVDADLQQLKSNVAYIDDLTATNAKVETLEAEYAEIDELLAGNITADNIKAGSITSESGVIGDLSANNITTGTLDAGKIKVTNLSADVIKTGTLDASLVTVTNIDATHIGTGTLDASKIKVTNLSASSITTGTLDASRITVTNLSASNIVTGTLDASRITVTNINANNITAGTIDASRISVTNINASNITTGTIDATKITISNMNAGSITGGTIDAVRVQIINLNASNITSGTIDASRINVTNLNASNITSGTIDASRIQISGSGGNLTLADNTITIRDTNLVNRVQVGKDATGGYGIIVSNAEGNVIFDSEYGVYEAGLQDNTISNDKIKDETIKSDKLFLDEILASTAFIEKFRAVEIDANQIRVNKITSDQLDIEGIISFTKNPDVFGSDIKWIFDTSQDKTWINGGAIWANSVTADKINVKGLKVETTDKVTAFQIFNKEDADASNGEYKEGDVLITGTLKSSNFDEATNVGYKITKDGDVHINNALIRGDVLLPSAGITNYGGSIGNENLVKNSDFSNGNSNWSFSIASVDKTKLFEGRPTLKLTKTGATADAWGGAQQDIDIRGNANIKNQAFTVSFWYYVEDKSTIDTTIAVELKGKNASGGHIGAGSYWSATKDTVVEKKWTYVSYTFTPTSSDLDKLFIYPWIKRNGTVWFAKFKVERSNKATPWCPNESDNSNYVRFWAGASYENRDEAPFQVLQDGTVKAKVGEFGGTFTGQLEIGNIHIADTNESTASIKLNTNNNAQTLIELTEDTSYINTNFIFGSKAVSHFTYTKGNGSFKFTNAPVSIEGTHSFVKFPANDSAVLANVGYNGGTYGDYSHQIKYSGGGLRFNQTGVVGGGHADFQFTKEDGATDATVSITGNVKVTNTIQMGGIQIINRTTGSEKRIDFVVL